MTKCDTCGREYEHLRKCAYCGKHFCPVHYADHMSWEQRHAGLASERGRFWRKKTAQPR